MPECEVVLIRAVATRSGVSQGRAIIVRHFVLAGHSSVDDKG